MNDPDAERDWQDRLLDSALHEVSGRRPPDLTARIMVELSEQPGGELPTLRRSPTDGARLPMALLAAALMLLGMTATFLLVKMTTRPAPATAVVSLDVHVARGAIEYLPATDATASPSTAMAGRKITVVPRNGDRLLAVPHSHLTLATFPSLTTDVLPAQLEIHSMEVTMKNGVVAAASLTVGVIAGIVSWNAIYGKETAGPGEVVHLEAEAVRQGVTAENARLLDRIAELEKERDQLLTMREEVASNQPESIEEPPPPPPPETGSSLMFDDERYSDVLSKIDWATMGKATHEMQPLLTELVRTLEEDGEISTELAVKIQQLNGDLLAQVPELLKAGLPGTGTNGAYTHPVVVANVLANTLQAAGLALDPAQSQAMKGLIRSFGVELDSIEGGQHEFAAEAMLQELETKERFYEEMSTRLTPEQFAAIYPEGSKDYDGVSLFGTGLMSRPFTRPVPAKNASEFARRTGARLGEELQLDEANTQKLRGIIEKMTGNASQLWEHKGNTTETKLNMMRSGRTITALRHQVTMLREIARQIPLTAEQRERLADLRGVLVPLPQ